MEAYLKVTHPLLANFYSFHKFYGKTFQESSAEWMKALEAIRKIKRDKRKH